MRLRKCLRNAFMGSSVAISERNLSSVRPFFFPPMGIIARYYRRTELIRPTE